MFRNFKDNILRFIEVKSGRFTAGPGTNVGNTGTTKHGSKVIENGKRQNVHTIRIQVRTEASINCLGETQGPAPCCFV